MNESRLTTVEQLRAFLAGTLEVQFQPLNDDQQRYALISSVLSRFGYQALGRADKGVVLRYLGRTTGYSRQQLTRLVARWRSGAPLAKRYKPPVAGFTCKFSAADVALLARTDALHGTLSGPATVHLLRRAAHLYGDERFGRLASLSVSHLYNLRAQAGYRAQRSHWTKTRHAPVAIGQRRGKPVPVTEFEALLVRDGTSAAAPSSRGAGSSKTVSTLPPCTNWRPNTASLRNASGRSRCAPCRRCARH